MESDSSVIAGKVFREEGTRWLDRWSRAGQRLRIFGRENRIGLLWAAIPVLAIAAYLTVLRIGFLSDDLVLVNQAASRGFDPGVFVPSRDWTFYRPVGVVITWQVGWLLWGFNALPYHVAGLLFHAISALVLGLWLAELTARRMMGWYAGALFAVFPLNTEAVGWLSAQWDTLAVMFGLLSLWLFTKWWRGRSEWWIFAGSVVCFGLGVFSKESLFTFLPVFALAAWVATPHFNRVRLVRLGLALVPFGLVLAANVGLRLVTWHTVGGYYGVPTDWTLFIWKAIGRYLGILTTPVSSEIFPGTVVRLVGVAVLLFVAGGVLLTARQWGRILLVSAVWIVCSIIPVLNLYESSVNAGSLEGNRYLYLASAGYCVGLGVFCFVIGERLFRLRRAARLAGGVVVCGVILGCVGACWLQLRPWHTATVQVAAIDEELRELVPAQVRTNGMVWYVQNPPRVFKGAFVYALGLGYLRPFTAKVQDVPWVEKVGAASEAPLVDEDRDSYALRFGYYAEDERFHVNYGIGITRDVSVPRQEDGARNLAVWDFRDCETGVVGGWQVAGGTATCKEGEGLRLEPENADLQMVEAAPAGEAWGANARFVRLRVAAEYEANGDTGKDPNWHVSEWFWKGNGQDWDSKQSTSVRVREDGKAYVYWAFRSSEEAGGQIAQLRFDPINTQSDVKVLWIAVDEVEGK